MTPGYATSNLGFVRKQLTIGLRSSNWSGDGLTRTEQVREFAVVIIEIYGEAGEGVMLDGSSPLTI